MDEQARQVSTISLLALVAALVGGWYGHWAREAGFALNSISWGFSVVLIPAAIVAGIVLARERIGALRIGATAQAAMTLAFSVFSFALRTTPSEIRKVPWQVLVVLVGDVAVTMAGLGLAAGGLAYTFAAWRARRG